MKKLDIIMWGTFAVTAVIAVISMIVLFGILYSPGLMIFGNLLPLEVSLSISLLLWGISSLYSSYGKKGKGTFMTSVIMGGILLVFAVFGVY